MPEINLEKFKILLRYIFSIIQEIDAELMAHRILVLGLKQTLEMNELDTLLEACRKNPGIADYLKKNYEIPLETLFQKLDQASADQALEQFLRSWKPKGQAN